ncbi:diguanylate cyclase [Pandoraea capi]|uniref:diguanylate cyclase n=1 Tax=Pandoraea capi TaxID=2508286 RepID=A0ABY6VZ03_9BURK|nr:diguanylate cyclase [Pandoraea capi]
MTQLLPVGQRLWLYLGLSWVVGVLLCLTALTVRLPPALSPATAPGDFSGGGTGIVLLVLNLVAINDRFPGDFEQARRAGHPLSLLMVDVDHFKRYNDEHGHPVGDECLEHVALALMRSTHRPTDLVARYGG